MTTVGEIMTPDAKVRRRGRDARSCRAMVRDLDVGQLPIGGDDGRLKGVLADRDIVVSSVAEGGDARTTTAGTLANGKSVTIGADDSVEEAIETMTSQRIRRLPVIDGHKLVG